MTDPRSNGPWLANAIKELQLDVRETRTKVDKIDRCVAGLRVKSSLWGGIAGALAAGAAFLVSWLK